MSIVDTIFTLFERRGHATYFSERLVTDMAKALRRSAHAVQDAAQLLDQVIQGFPSRTVH
jgi:hypothetical protein